MNLQKLLNRTFVPVGYPVLAYFGYIAGVQGAANVLAVLIFLFFLVSITFYMKAVQESFKEKNPTRFKLWGNFMRVWNFAMASFLIFNGAWIAGPLFIATTINMEINLFDIYKED